MFSHNS